jgi:hypothetical protein
MGWDRPQASPPANLGVFLQAAPWRTARCTSRRRGSEWHTGADPPAAARAAAACGSPQSSRGVASPCRQPGTGAWSCPRCSRATRPRCVRVGIGGWVGCMWGGVSARCVGSDTTTQAQHPGVSASCAPASCRSSCRDSLEQRRGHLCVPQQCPASRIGALQPLSNPTATPQHE